MAFNSLMASSCRMPCSVSCTRVSQPQVQAVSLPISRSASRHVCRALQTEKETPQQKPSTSEPSSAETTEKYGLEAGLFKVFTSKSSNKEEKTNAAAQLLKQYGSAYLITSISFAIVSFAICYAAVNAGVDVNALLSKIGLTPSDTSEKVGTVAIAYAAHKALSPVRFPPTVALTPVVAKWLGQKVLAADDSAGGSSDKKQ